MTLNETSNHQVNQPKTTMPSIFWLRIFIILGFMPGCRNGMADFQVFSRGAVMSLDYQSKTSLKYCPEFIHCIMNSLGILNGLFLFHGYACAP